MPRKSKKDKIKEALYNELKKLSKTANQRLLRLERKFGADSWASKKLRNRLDTAPVQAWTSSGRVRVNKKMSISQLRATIKATEQFLNSKTSTVSGIKKVVDKTKKSLAKHLEKNYFFGEDEAGKQSQDLSYKEADLLYDMLGEDYIKDLLQYIGASELWAIIEDAKEVGEDKEGFFDSFNLYANVDFNNDLDMKEKINKIFEKYVK